MTLPLISDTPNTQTESATPQTSMPKIARIEIDRELCIGAESCVIVAPEVYEMDDENIAVLKDPHGADDQTILESAQACPVAAILLFDEDGNQIYP